MADELLERKQKTSSGVLSEAPRRDTYDPKVHGSGNPHLQPGELQKAWHGDKSAKPKKQGFLIKHNQNSQHRVRGELSDPADVGHPALFRVGPLLLPNNEESNEKADQRPYQKELTH